MITPSDALKKWDEEEKTEKKPTADEAVKAMIREGDKLRWKAEDRPFVKKLIDHSIKVAAECNRSGNESIKDIFLSQAARLEQELRQLESLYGVYTEPKAEPAKKRTKKRARRKR